MRIVGQMVVRDEADRYLDACLSWAKLLVDELHVYDEGSSDDTPDIAFSHGTWVSRRPASVPSFLEAEHVCRQDAWRRMEKALHLEPGDWVLCLDADEFLVSYADERADLLEYASMDVDGVEFPVAEVFELNPMGGPPAVRVDGFWGQIRATRFVRWYPDLEFTQFPLPGRGSVPYFLEDGRVEQAKDTLILHYGYAVQEDAKRKYERYSARNLGHSNRHIESIVQPAVLRAWTGPSVPVWRGRG